MYLLSLQGLGKTLLAVIQQLQLVSKIHRMQEPWFSQQAPQL